MYSICDYIYVTTTISHGAEMRDGAEPKGQRVRVLYTPRLIALSAVVKCLMFKVCVR